MAFTVPDLPYAYDALAPYVDEATMHLHHDKHHQAYVDKTNGALAGTEWESRSIDDIVANLSSIPEAVRGVVRNNGGGHANHSMFWESMAAPGSDGTTLSGPLESEIVQAFGSVDDFRTAFEAAGVAQFGSGWVWLVLDGGKLAITSTPNQDSPLTVGQVPLLGNDVWEHAYYLTYNNRRPEYLKQWWNVVNWGAVTDRYTKAAG
jgi:Fe-Mn family superoxide dismutase